MLHQLPPAHTPHPVSPLLSSSTVKKGEERATRFLPVLPAPPWVPPPSSIRSGGGRVGEPRICAFGLYIGCRSAWSAAVLAWGRRRRIRPFGLPDPGLLSSLLRCCDGGSGGVPPRGWWSDGAIFVLWGLRPRACCRCAAASSIDGVRLLRYVVWRSPVSSILSRGEVVFFSAKMWLVEGGVSGALVFPAPVLGRDLWRMDGRCHFLLWLRPEVVSTCWQKIGDGSPPMIDQRWHIPAAASDVSCGASTQSFCYRASVGFWCVVTSRSSSLAACRRRGRRAAMSGAVYKRKDLQGLRCNFLFFRVFFVFFLDRCLSGWFQSVVVCLRCTPCVF